ncbi:MAG: hypothetical protein N4A43_03380 [Alphaproteobacteria bacterium]|jgi:hypothetical protein|nr:hypothetical protein [Alphaproteobacteria bacterium]
MKKITILILLLFINYGEAFAQSIWTDSVKVKKQSPASYNNQNRRWRGRTTWSSRNGYYDYITLDNIEKRISIMAQDIKNSPQYGERKKKHLLKDLEYSRIKFRQADINNDGALSEHEQQLYKEKVFID